MDLFIRNVDTTAVKVLDELAKKKKQSRSVYLKNLLENHVQELKPARSEVELKKLVETNTLFLEKAETAIQEFTKTLSMLLDEESE